MKCNTSTTILGQTVRSICRRSISIPDLCFHLRSLRISPYRQLHSSPQRLKTKTLNPTIAEEFRPVGTQDPARNALASPAGALKAKPDELQLTPAQRAAAAAATARAKLRKQEQTAQQGLRMGGLSKSSVFADAEMDALIDDGTSEKPAIGMAEGSPTALVNRSPANMSLALNPRPHARARWQRKMVIREVRHGGRITKEMKIARSERSHLSRSHFFKTSMKKLAPLARQIAGKSIDDAIVQMRFSRKKAADEVRQHLIQARDEAIAVRGMGLQPAIAQAADDTTTSDTSATVSPVIDDATTTAPAPHQTAGKATKPGRTSETDIYVAQAWVNRGPYGQKPDYRARGRLYIMRPPYTGISVLLKEEKTRTREQEERDAKALRKRMGKNMWTQLPDRKVTRQSQYVLW